MTKGSDVRKALGYVVYFLIKKPYESLIIFIIIKAILDNFGCDENVYLIKIASIPLVIQYWYILKQSSRKARARAQVGQHNLVNDSFH